MQFYSQGSAYTTCGTLVNASGDPFPATSLLEVVGMLNANADARARAGVNGGGGVQARAGANVGEVKVVLGKPGTPADVGVPEGGGTGVAGGGGGTQVAGGGGTQVAGGGTQVAGGGTQVAGGGTQVAGGGRKRGGVDPHINGYLEPESLAQCLVDAKAKGWTAGVMAWEASRVRACDFRG